MGIYTVYFGVGVVVFLIGVVAFAVVDRFTERPSGGPTDAESGTAGPGENGDAQPGEADAVATLLRTIPLFVAIVGLGGILFGGVGMLTGLLG